MDETDREIIFNLLKNGRVSQNKLAKIVNLAPPSLNARFKRLIDEGIIRDFKVFINPNLINKYFAYYAFPNLREAHSDKIFVKFNCLENFNVYGFLGNSINEIRETVRGIEAEVGNPIMEYLPPQSPLKPKKLHLLLLRTLVENPRAEMGEIAHALNLKVSKVKRLMSELKGVTIIPEVDLIKADSLLLGVFTKKVDEIRNITNRFSIITISGVLGGVDVSFVGSIRNAKEIVDKVRGVDPQAQVMLVYNYEIRTDTRNLELE
ncbi:transcriptional regulator [Sulfolobus sp. B1]|uniref:Lrp/AsnC family transcriptional regulator n=1 Tax=Sulfolobaceae TaxID=118883 RepID=UPI000845DB0F|nr:MULTISPECIES: winged helix-turn-helix transcriptional regulator [unclassified Sulfolobus]TRM74727.1 transcriptional regulator [Sulfolobus sp. A20-N-F8]TRM75975.1 transcriptional regulator [Sulfolobus sp. E5]TRM79598.1 transcriptional regulator [Sulfolobus sp. B5]TRM86950.1 transcriptional regulator [Sulfolobus sp. C3]TRM93726.1 transcriptional regulator [Sulfolobus sp. A20-N-G8]TRN01743.1 transcriptional regulator [Sulfolobus sp. F1]TRN03979.1 transcriptional regulator [Sulfolobus sp. E1]